MVTTWVIIIYTNKKKINGNSYSVKPYILTKPQETMLLALRKLPLGYRKRLTYWNEKCVANTRGLWWTWIIDMKLKIIISSCIEVQHNRANCSITLCSSRWDKVVKDCASFLCLNFISGNSEDDIDVRWLAAMNCWKWEEFSVVSMNDMHNNLLYSSRVVREF